MARPCHRAAARRHLLFCQKLGGQLPTLPTWHLHPWITLSIDNSCQTNWGSFILWHESKFFENIPWKFNKRSDSENIPTHFEGRSKGGSHSVIQLFVSKCQSSFDPLVVLPKYYKPPKRVKRFGPCFPWNYTMSNPQVVDSTQLGLPWLEK